MLYREVIHWIYGIEAIYLESLPQAGEEERVLLHGDFWLGNILCKDGEIAAVLDWEDACTGSPLLDLSNTRLELLWSHGRNAMERFTEIYARRTGRSLQNLPSWDLYTSLYKYDRISRWIPDVEKVKRFQERLLEFASDSISKIPSLEGRDFFTILRQRT